MSNNSSAAALLSYDVAHSIPWDWRVSLYTWTKSIASGVYIVMALLVLLGFARADAINDLLTGMISYSSSPLWITMTPVLGGIALAATGALLIWDLEHPERFHLIFTRAQWRSWLVKGAFIIAGYSAVLAIHFVAGLLGSAKLQVWMLIVGLPLAIMTAVYTAYLFAQAKARDLWQNALLPPHLFVQALLAGAAVLIPFAMWLEPSLVTVLLKLLSATSLVHLLLVLGEITLVHPTAHARLAVCEMVRGRYRSFFWIGLALSAIGLLAPWIAMAAVPTALAGLLLYEHAYVQAGQSVPLA